MDSGLMDHCRRCGHPRAHHAPRDCVWRGAEVCDCFGFLSKSWPQDDIPKHMRESASFYSSETYSGFSPEFYEESECECGKPIYRYQMDVEVRWRHFNHRQECFVSPLAKPRGK